MQFTKTILVLAGAAALAACGGREEANNSADANLMATEPSPMAVDANMTGTDMNGGMGADMNMTTDMNAGTGTTGTTATGTTGANTTVGTGNSTGGNVTTNTL